MIEQSAVPPNVIADTICQHAARYVVRSGRAGAGWGDRPPDMTAHRSREAVLWLSYHVAHHVVGIRHAAARPPGETRKLRGFRQEPGLPKVRPIRAARTRP